MTTIQAIIVSLIVQIAASQVAGNQFWRRAYYNRHDNVCSPEWSDSLTLSFTLPDRSKVEAVATDATACDGRAWDPISKMSLHSLFEYIDFDRHDIWAPPFTYVRFNQETVYRKFLFDLVGIDLKLTPINPMTVNKVIYNCEIQGGGSVVHYDRTPEHPRPVIHMECKTVQKAKNIQV